MLIFYFRWENFEIFYVGGGGGEIVKCTSENRQ